MTASRLDAALALARCLAGTPPGPVDWDAVIALANQSLTITDLAAAAAALPEDEVPGAVRAYLDDILRRNRRRNEALLALLGEVVSRLGAAGIEVAVMKGAAVLLTDAAAVRRRLLIDLDLLVRPGAMAAAIEALAAIGFTVRTGAAPGSWPGEPAFHLPTVLARDGDVASIDLQCRPRGPASFADVGWLFAHSAAVACGDGHVLVPEPAVQTVYLLLHDQFQDGDYWRGLVDLRHLADMAVLLSPGGGVDLDALRSLFSKGYERHAVDTQLATLGLLFPPGPLAGMEAQRPLARRVRWQIARRRVQLQHPALRPVLTLLTLASELGSFRAWDRFGGRPEAGTWREARRQLRELRRIFRPVALGKL